MCGRLTQHLTLRCWHAKHISNHAFLHHFEGEEEEEEGGSNVWSTGLLVHRRRRGSPWGAAA